MNRSSVRFRQAAPLSFGFAILREGDGQRVVHRQRALPPALVPGAPHLRIRRRYTKQVALHGVDAEVGERLQVVEGLDALRGDRCVELESQQNERGDENSPRRASRPSTTWRRSPTSAST